MDHLAVPQQEEEAERLRRMLAAQVEECLEQQQQLEEDQEEEASSALASLMLSQGVCLVLQQLDRTVSEELCSSCLSNSRSVLVLRALLLLLTRSSGPGTREELLREGLTVKVLSWFQTLCDLLSDNGGSSSSAALTGLAEEFLDFFLQLNESCSLPVDQLSAALLRVADLSLEPKIHFSLRLEGMETFSHLLESLDQARRKQIQKDVRIHHLLFHLAAALHTAGDYELQVRLLEALCRLSPCKQRRSLAQDWFNPKRQPRQQQLCSLFCDITGRDFETGSRKFLNSVNRVHGHRSGIFTFPCLRVFVGSVELFRPKDNKLKMFWIDFNLSSSRVSCYVDDPESFLWDLLQLERDQVQSFGVQTRDRETALLFSLKFPIKHRGGQALRLEVIFRSSFRRRLEVVLRRVLRGVCASLAEGSRLSSALSLDRVCTYGRRRTSHGSALKVLPVSSPSSEEDTRAHRGEADIPFDQIMAPSPPTDQDLPDQSNEEPVAKRRADQKQHGGFSTTQEADFLQTGVGEIPLESERRQQQLREHFSPQPRLSDAARAEYI